VRAYVINLARSSDRRAHITAELKKAGLEYEFITAVDGQELDLGDPAIIDPSFVTRIIFPAGSAGCALSHVNVYRKVIDDGVDAALVIEDDVMLPADIVSLADAVAGQLSGAEVALLSFDSPEPCRVSREGSVSLPSQRLLALPIDLTQPRSTGTYVITREACERMAKSLLPIKVQADMWWSFYREGLLDRVRCVVPMPVEKNPEFTSMIGSYSLGDGVRARLIGSIMRAEIPVLHQVLARRRQRIYRQWSRTELVDEPFVEKPSRLE
jgi:glycosyl transferase, family 25